MGARDSFAFAGTEVDPLIALGAKKSDLEQQIHATANQSLDAEEVDAICDRLTTELIAVEDQITSAIPVTAAGAAVQLRYLRQHARDFEWGEYAERLVAKLLAGLVRGLR